MSENLRLVMIGESPSMPTGFGTQTKLVTEGLARRGWDVTLLAQSVPMDPVPLDGVTEWRYANIHDVSWIDTTIHTLAPDAVLVFNCTGSISALSRMRAAPQNCPVFFWFPYEGRVVPPDARKLFTGMTGDCMIHLSGHADKIWSSVFHSGMVVPHCVDSSLFLDMPDQQTLRDKWSRRLRMPLFGNSFLVFSAERNIWHKRWDASFDFVVKLQAILDDEGVDREVVLLAHTKKVQKDVPGHPAGFSLPDLEKAYDLRGRIFYTDFDFDKGMSRRDIAELLVACDMRLTTSSGEGFGILTIEAADARVPQVVNQYACAPELLPEGSPFLVEPGMVESRVGSLWDVPDTGRMVRRAFDLLLNPDSEHQLRRNLARHLDEAQAFVRDNFSIDRVCDRFDNIFRSAIKRKLLPYYEHRFGLYSERLPGYFRDIVQLISKVSPHAKVLEIGAFAGGLAVSCDEFGMDYHGIEWDEEAISRASSRAQRFMERRHPDPETPWPLADVLVLHNQIERLYWLGGLELVRSVLTAAADYRWVFINNDVEYRWHSGVVDRAVVSDAFMRAGLVPRKDLADAIREHIHREFTFDIWARAELDDGSVPKAVASAMKSRS